MIDPPQLPVGDDNPDRTFAAVGNALSCWEQLETAFAHLFTVFAGQPYQVDALEAFGSAYGMTMLRQQAIVEAAARYFIAHPHQDREGAVSSLVSRWRLLNIKRHRIAHGGIRGVPVMGAAEGLLVQTGMSFTIGAPIYAAAALKTDWRGVGSAEIDLTATEFNALAQEVRELSQRIAPQ